MQAIRQSSSVNRYLQIVLDIPAALSGSARRTAIDRPPKAGLSDVKAGAGFIVARSCAFVLAVLLPPVVLFLEILSQAGADPVLASFSIATARPAAARFWMPIEEA